MELAGRSAIITGASEGLGRAIAAAFVESGASVFLVARKEGKLREFQQELANSATLPNQRVEAMAGDVSRAECCQAIVERARQVLADISILVNNAGVYGPIGPVEQNDWQEWVQAIEINLFGTVLMCRAVIPIMRAQRYGKIVNLSGGGATSPLPRFSSYAAAKAAVVRLTETLAQELADAHIDINAIAPGSLNTRLLSQVLEAGPARVGKDMYEKSLKQQANGGASLEKGADLAVFLASPASDGISGRLIAALWDNWSTLPEKRDRLRDIYTLRRIIPEDRGEAW